MPYRKLFLSDASHKMDDAAILPIPDGFPDINAFTEYFEIKGAMLIIDPDIESEDEAKALTAKHAHEFDEHWGQAAFLRKDGALIWGKVVPARVPIETIVEWFVEARDRNREALAKGMSHYPDRPPDVDTEGMRAWVMHPGRPDEEGAASVTRPEHDPDHPKSPEIIYTASIGMPDHLFIKVLLSWHWAWELDKDPDGWPSGSAGAPRNSVGAYELRFKMEHESDPDVLIDRSRYYTLEETDQCWEAVEGLIATASKVKVNEGGTSTNYFDYLEMEEQFKTAYQEIDEYYAAERERNPKGTTIGELLEGR